MRLAQTTYEIFSGNPEIAKTLGWIYYLKNAIPRSRASRSGHGQDPYT